MEPAIIAALVAGGVSVAGLIAQFILAKQTRITQREQIAGTAQIEISKDVVSGMRALENETESLRILAWQSITIIDDAEGLDTSLPGDSLNRLTSCLNKLSSDGSEFLQSWANVKYDIHEEYDDYLRRRRHECRHLLAGVGAVAECIQRDIEQAPDSLNTDRYVRDAKHYLEQLLFHLDHFGRGVAAVRHQLIQSAAIGR